MYKMDVRLYFKRKESVRERCRGMVSLKRVELIYSPLYFFFVWGKDCHPFIHYKYIYPSQFRIC